MITAQKKFFSFPVLRNRAEEEAAGLEPLLAAARQAAQTVISGEHARRKSGIGEKFWQFRDYHPGDRPQDIDWRQSAKGDRVFVRQKEQQTAQTALFWCADGPGMDYRSDAALPSKREAALVLSLALALLMARAGEKVGMLDGRGNPGRGDAALQALGQNLLERQGAILPAPGGALPRQAQLVLAGDFLEPPESIEAAFDPLSARAESVLVIQILDPAERTLPFSGRVIFEDMAHGKHHHVMQVSAVRAAYRERMEAHVKAVTALCRRRQWRWLLHETDKPVSKTLAEAWMMLSRTEQNI
jgi:uncharacterized protein (DUF58 family)